MERSRTTFQEDDTMSKRYFPTANYFDSDDPLCVAVQDGAWVYALPFAGGRATHSPTGYAWGYHGSGPAELARAILADYLGRVPQGEMYQRFKNEMIATLKQDDTSWIITSTAIELWLGSYRREKREEKRS
jgi:hypothetical protein